MSLATIDNLLSTQTLLREPVLDKVVSHGVARGLVLRKAIPLIIERGGWEYDIINWCRNTGGVSEDQILQIRLYIRILPRDISKTGGYLTALGYL